MFNKSYKNIQWKNKYILALLILTITPTLCALLISKGLWQFPWQRNQFSDLFSSSDTINHYKKALMEIIAKQETYSRDNTLNTNDSMVQSKSSKKTPRQPIDDLFNELFIAFVRNNPQLLTSLGLFESRGIQKHNTYLNDLSPEAIGQDFENQKKYLPRLEDYPLENLSREQKITYQVELYALRHLVAGKQFLYHDYQLNHFRGALAFLIATFTVDHPLRTRQDFQNYLIRLQKIPTQLQQLIRFSLKQKKLGIILPVFSLEKVVTMIQKLCTHDTTQNIFYARFTQELKKLDLDKKETLLTQAQVIIEKTVYPAFQSLQKHCTQLQTTTKANNGVWALPNGDKYYAHLLEHYTTIRLSADEIHEIGLQEISRINKEMRQLLAQEGLNDPEKTVGELMQKFAQQPQFYYPETKSGRTDCLAHFEAIVERSKQDLYHLFNIKPHIPVLVKAIPAHETHGKSSAYFQRPSIDGTRPGIFFANLRSMKELPTYKMETLAIHEAIPGHHFQIAVQLEQDIHILRKIKSFTAYHEGWALYAEKLAYENGFYSSPASELGHLLDELWRAVRLVVDTGIHKKRWSREKAIEYMYQETGINKNKIASEIERYFVSPGQACSYKIGQLKILELRQRAKDVLGEKFNIRSFHDAILKNGPVPLEILEEIVDDYIKTTSNNV